MIKKILSGLMSILLVFLLSGCKASGSKGTDVKPTETKTASSDAKNQEKKLDAGKIDGNTYTNDFFNLTVKIPEKWSIASDSEKETLVGVGKDALAGQSESKKEMFDLSLQRSSYLLIISEKPMLAGGQSNRSLIIMAEKVDFFPEIQNGEDYLSLVKKQLENFKDKIPYKIGHDFSVKIGSKDFSVFDVSIDLGSSVVVQRYYSCIIDGYALSFVSSGTATSVDDFKDDIADSISIK